MYTDPAIRETWDDQVEDGKKKGKRKSEESDRRTEAARKEAKSIDRYVAQHILDNKGEQSESSDNDYISQHSCIVGGADARPQIAGQRPKGSGARRVLRRYGATARSLDRRSYASG